MNLPSKGAIPASILRIALSKKRTPDELLAEKLSGIAGIINGYLLSQGEMINPDHPDSSHKDLRILGVSVPKGLQRKLAEIFSEGGYELQFRSQVADYEPTIICRLILQSDEERMENIVALLEAAGHYMLLWQKSGQAAYWTRCMHDGCELKVCFRKLQDPNDNWIYTCGNTPMPKLFPCPCSEDRMDAHDRQRFKI
jgi:hypothetical protein